MKALRPLLLTALCCILSFFNGYGQSAPEDDALLQILLREADNHSGIVTEKAYPITSATYRIEEVQEYYLGVSFGSVTQRTSIVKRAGTSFVEISQVGNPMSITAYYLFALPTTNDESTLHRLFQFNTQRAYDSSIRYYLAKINGFLSSSYEEEAPFVPGYEPLPTQTSFNEEVLIDKLQKSTAIFEHVPNVVNCIATISYELQRKWTVQEKDYSAHNDIKTRLNLVVERQTDEGKLERHWESFTFENPDDIFLTEEIQEHLWKLYNGLDTNSVYEASITNCDSLMLKDWWLTLDSSTHEQTSILDVLQEMTRQGRDSLHLGDHPSPYFLSYLLTDAHVADITAILGFTSEAEEHNRRYLETTVEIGSDVRNSSHFKVPGPYLDEAARLFYYENIPFDNHKNNLKRQLWWSAARRYPYVVQLFKMKESSLQSMQEEAYKILPDRSEAITKNVVAEQTLQQECLPQLQNYACEFSQILGRTRIESWVRITSYQANAYYADATGLYYAQPLSYVHIMIADDQENFYKAFCFKEIDELEAHHDSLVAAIEGIREMLDARAKAPTMDEIYDGPVLMVGDAAVECFATAFLQGKESLIAQREPLKMVTGIKPWLPSRSPMSWLIDKRIIHPGISITAEDPLDTYNGMPLIGSYQVDAEGVQVEQKLELVNHGELVTLLSNRTPTAGVAYSNGHQRFAINIFNNELTRHCGPGVLTMQCKSTLSYPKLLKRLREKARAAGYNHAYLITNLGERLILYRVNIHNGKMTLVRDADLETITYRNFQQMSCADSETRAHNFLLYKNFREAIPCSVIMPHALLFERLELTPTR
ncbi:MAG: hypothetical protein IKU03_05600 [Bacteroidales bacterium]|nr:hypothetical protein [Bacteroidales bacterium]